MQPCQYQPGTYTSLDNHGNVEGCGEVDPATGLPVNLYPPMHDMAVPFKELTQSFPAIYPAEVWESYNPAAQVPPRYAQVQPPQQPCYAPVQPPCYAPVQPPQQPYAQLQQFWQGQQPSVQLQQFWQGQQHIPTSSSRLQSIVAPPPPPPPPSRKRGTGSARSVCSQMSSSRGSISSNLGSTDSAGSSKTILSQAKPKPSYAKPSHASSLKSAATRDLKAEIAWRESAGRELQAIPFPSFPSNITLCFAFNNGRV
jgi:hypothetical protein